MQFTSINNKEEICCLKVGAVKVVSFGLFGEKGEVFVGWQYLAVIRDTSQATTIISPQPLRSFGVLQLMALSRHDVELRM